MTDPIRMTAPPPPQAEAQATDASEHAETAATEGAEPVKRPRLEPTRYGDWEFNGKCVDF